jgi:hypothetical protein
MAPSKCPKCNSTKVVRIQYGYPTKAAFDAADREEIIIGGCVVDDHNPRRHCNDSEHDWK